MVEFFVADGRPFKYFLPDGTVIDSTNGVLDGDPLREFFNYEIKIVYLPTEEIINHSSGDTDVEVFDDVYDAIATLPLLFKKLKWSVN